MTLASFKFLIPLSPSPLNLSHVNKWSLLHSLSCDFLTLTKGSDMSSTDSWISHRSVIVCNKFST